MPANVSTFRDVVRNTREHKYVREQGLESERERM